MGSWRVTGEGVWQHQKRTSRGWYLNTTAIALEGGRAAVFSPTARLDEAAHEELVTAIGTPAFLVAPNYYHWLGIPEWLERYPDAEVVCSDGAAPRLRKNLKGVATCGALEPLRTELPASMQLIEPPGTRNGELWLRAEGEGEVLWSVSDAWFNVPENPSGGFGLACRLLKVSPGFRIGGTWKLFALRDRAAYRDWLLSQLRDDPPTRLTVSHGQVADGPDLAALLEEQARRGL